MHQLIRPRPYLVVAWGNSGWVRILSTLSAPVVPRLISRDPPLDSVPEVFQVDDLMANVTDLEQLLAVAGRTPLAGQFDHLVDPDGVPSLLPFLIALSPRVGPSEDLVPLVIEVGTLVDVIEAREAGVLSSRTDVRDRGPSASPRYGPPQGMSSPASVPGVPPGAIRVRRSTTAFRARQSSALYRTNFSFSDSSRLLSQSVLQTTL